MQLGTAAIAGAGIVGQLLALALSRAGWQVSIFDPDPNNNCSHAAAGLLTPIAELATSDAVIYQLGIDALQTHWPETLQQLSQPLNFQQQGSLLVSHPRDQSDLAEFIRLISSKLPNKSSYQKIDQAEIKKLEPQLEKFEQGYYFPDEGCIDSQHLLSVLAQELSEKITWHAELVTDIQPGKIVVNDTAHHFDMVFDCRGLGAKSTFSDLRGVRGELIWLHAPEVHITRPIRILHPRYSLYIAPRANQTYLVGASEIESEEKDEISVRSMLELLTAVFYVNAGFAEARILKTVTHCRPTLSDHLPRIKYTSGFAAINGLYRHGFLIAPTLVEDVMQWVRDDFSAVKYPQLWEEHFV